MAGSTKRSDKKYSYADYLQWQDDKRREIIDGAVFDMNAPLRIHQEILLEIGTKLHAFFKEKACSIYIAPFDVRLPKSSRKNEDIFNVVQPDISVVCDEAKLDEKGCIGAPDLVIEIISPSTASIDNIKKRALYEESGVKEYWLLHPTDRILTIYNLKENCYEKPLIYADNQKVASLLFPDLIIDLAEIFPLQPQIVCENPPPTYGK